MFTFENMRKEILIGREMKVVVQRQDRQQKEDKAELMKEIKDLKAQIALLIANANSSIQ